MLLESLGIMLLMATTLLGAGFFLTEGPLKLAPCDRTYYLSSTISSGLVLLGFVILWLGYLGIYIFDTALILAGFCIYSFLRNFHILIFERPSFKKGPSQGPYYLILLLMMLPILLSNFTQPFTDHDAVVEWDIWPKHWAMLGDLSHYNFGYAQLIPSVFSLFYLLTRTYAHILPPTTYVLHFFHGVIGLMILFMAFNLCRAIFDNRGLWLGLLAVSLFLMLFDIQWIFTNGRVDIFVLFFLFQTLTTLEKCYRSRNFDPLFLFRLVISASGLAYVKQTGLYWGVFFMILGIGLSWKTGKSLGAGKASVHSSFGRIVVLSLMIFGVIVLPFYTHTWWLRRTSTRNDALFHELGGNNASTYTGLTAQAHDELKSVYGIRSEAVLLRNMCVGIFLPQNHKVSWMKGFFGSSYAYAILAFLLGVHSLFLIKLQGAYFKFLLLAYATYAVLWWKCLSYNVANFVVGIGVFFYMLIHVIAYLVQYSERKPALQKLVHYVAAAGTGLILLLSTWRIQHALETVSNNGLFFRQNDVERISAYWGGAEQAISLFLTSQADEIKNYKYKKDNFLLAADLYWDRLLPGAVTTDRMNYTAPRYQSLVNTLRSGDVSMLTRNSMPGAVHLGNVFYRPALHLFRWFDVYDGSLVVKDTNYNPKTDALLVVIQGLPAARNILSDHKWSTALVNAQDHSVIKDYGTAEESAPYGSSANLRIFDELPASLSYWIRVPQGMDAGIAQKCIRFSRKVEPGEAGESRIVMTAINKFDLYVNGLWALRGNDNWAAPIVVTRSFKKGDVIELFVRTDDPNGTVRVLFDAEVAPPSHTHVAAPGLLSLGELKTPDGGLLHYYVVEPFKGKASVFFYQLPINIKDLSISPADIRYFRIPNYHISPEIQS
jgi:hypothetical protein